MPGCHVTDQQVRLFMTFRQTHSVPVSAAKAGISQATGYRLQSDPILRPGLRKVFYTVPSRLIGHQLLARIYDDRLDLFLGETFLVTLPRACATRHGPHQHVVSYHHVIHSLRKKAVSPKANLRFDGTARIGLPARQQTRYHRLRQLRGHPRQMRGRMELLRK